MLAQADRIAFSLNIVTAASKLTAFNMSQAQTAAEIAKLVQLDGANKNLFDPTNVLVNFYQTEMNLLDGNLRTTVAEQNIQDAASRVLQNYFFPNDPNTVVPDLVANHNVWIRIPPFALNYAIGKNYTEGYGSSPNEPAIITTALGYITAAAAFTNIQLTTGESCAAPTPPATSDSIANDPAIQTLKTNLVTSVNSLVTTLNQELTALNAIVDSDATRTAQNTAAKNNISNVILPALTAWLAFVDFNTAHGQTTCAGFNAFNSNLLAPTKLHSVQLSALQTALNNRSTFLTTRVGQLNTNLGTIVQDLTTGELTTSTGLYGKRYGFLLLRLHTLDGSLAKLKALSNGKDAQDSIKANITNTKNTYMSILPTSLLKAPGNGSSAISVVDSSNYSVGDTVFVTADGQDELQRAVKSVNADGSMVLNDIVPAKYVPASNARIYKDIS